MAAALWRDPAGEDRGLHPPATGGSPEGDPPVPVQSPRPSAPADSWPDPGPDSPAKPHSETQKLWHNPFQFCFKLLNVGVICSAAVDDCVRMEYFLFVMW